MTRVRDVRKENSQWSTSRQYTYAIFKRPQPTIADGFANPEIISGKAVHHVEYYGKDRSDTMAFSSAAGVEVVQPGVKKGIATARAQWRLQSQMPRVDRAWNKVRNELAEVGLLFEPDATDEWDGYLDQIRLEVALLPSFNGEMGYVFEDLPWYGWLVGYEEGVIYLPSDLPSTAYVPGGTLTDVIRHEYGHTWHWLEPAFFDNDWFIDAFGDTYECDESTPVDYWVERRLCTRKHKKEMGKCRSEREIAELLQRRFREDFVSEYAATRFCEDFAETFMTYLRYRNSLDRFKARKGVYRKLKSVEKAVNRARLELGL